MRRASDGASDVVVSDPPYTPPPECEAGGFTRASECNVVERT